jgi:hypothetical protein
MSVRNDLLKKAKAVSPGLSGVLSSEKLLILDHETVTEAATACSPSVPITIIDNDGNEAISLANGTIVGQTKIFISSTNNTVTLTPATTAGSYSTIATTNIGETYGLMWTADGWAVIMRASGDTQADNAVDDLPVLA